MRKAINSIIEWIAIQKYIWRAKRNVIWNKIYYYQNGDKVIQNEENIF